MVAAGQITGSIPPVDVSAGAFGPPVDGFTGLWMRNRPTGWWLDPARLSNANAVFGFRCFNLLWNPSCCSTNGIMGDAVQRSCPAVMDIYCFFWTVGAGHTHALILMSPPAASCCSPLFLFSCYLLFLGVFAVFQQLSVPRSRGGKSDADTQRQSGDSEAASRLNSRIPS